MRKMFNENFEAQLKALQKMQQKTAQEASRLNKIALKKWQDFDVANQLKRVELPDFAVPERLTSKSCSVCPLRNKGKKLTCLILLSAIAGAALYFFRKKKKERLWKDNASDCYEFISDPSESEMYETAGIDALEEALDTADHENNQEA